MHEPASPSPQPRAAPTTRAARIATLALFFIGAGLCLSFIETMFGRPTVVIAAALFTAFAFAATARPQSRGARVTRVAATIPILGFYALAIYLALTWGELLAWTTSLGVRALVLALTAAALITRLRPIRGVRVPFALPLGVWITACLIGWQREEGFVRCDDLARVKADPSITILGPTSGALAECRPGAVLPIGRYPRKVWESPDSRRFVVTTQAGTLSIPESAPLAHFTGNTCEITPGGAPPRCIGDLLGKTQGIAVDDQRRHLLISGWGILSHGGHLGSAVYAVPLDGPFEIIEDHHFDGAFGDLFYVPKNDTIRLFRDECTDMIGVRASDFAPLPDSGPPACPGELRYEPERDEGVWCGGRGIATAFTGAPYTTRRLGEEGRPAAAVSLSWGCDWDPEGRKVYSTIPNLGLVDVIDYDTGRIEKSFFAGFGLRSTALDRARRRLYATDFLGGDVIAFDLATGRETARWFVGRYVRDVRLTRDGDAILATSNLGLLRITLK